MIIAQKHSVFWLIYSSSDLNLKKNIKNDYDFEVSKSLLKMNKPPYNLQLQGG